jgi:hypothetical protein
MAIFVICMCASLVWLWLLGAAAAAAAAVGVAVEATYRPVCLGVDALCLYPNYPVWCGLVREVVEA